MQFEARFGLEFVIFDDFNFFLLVHVFQHIYVLLSKMALEYQCILVLISANHLEYLFHVTAETIIKS